MEGGGERVKLVLYGVNSDGHTVDMFGNTESSNSAIIKLDKMCITADSAFSSFGNNLFGRDLDCIDMKKEEKFMAPLFKTQSRKSFIRFIPVSVIKSHESQKLRRAGAAFFLK
eukprot:gnl/Carplike_NY0171/9767_a13679_142.p1 GENE.gnl/Carplike_NY0171/9767_a13679_142~~gnl/Carplike_NY0171/9767_a13679_142.p1  ORF type:complete len:113 (+),score=18.79 gnl/Carplike_NY0171/9767_a13679_142:1-339(+)